MSQKRARVGKRFTRARVASALSRAFGTRRPRRKGFSLNTHSFSRYTAATNSVIDSTELDVGYEFKFSDMVAFSEFSNLFDRYKIDRVVQTFQLVNNPDATYALNVLGTANTNAATSYVNSTNFYPKMWYIHDYDDSNAESIGTLKERVGVKCRILQPNKVIKISTKPAIAIQTYKTALTAGYGPKWGQYIDMQTTDVPHYGLKVAFDTNAQDPTDTAPFRVRVETKYYFTCKDVR